MPAAVQPTERSSPSFVSPPRTNVPAALAASATPRATASWTASASREGKRHGEEEAEGLGADGGEVREGGRRREPPRGPRVAVEAEPDLLADRVDGEGEEPPVPQRDELGVRLVDASPLPGRAREEVGPAG